MITKYTEYIKENNSNSQFFKTYEETKEWLDKMRIKNYTINQDLTVDVGNYLDISNQFLTYIPVQFGIIEGWFYCFSNNLTNLIGSPDIIYGIDFDYTNNPITSLEGLTIYNLKKTINTDFYQELDSKIKEEYFDKMLEENPEIIYLINFETSPIFKKKWNHLFNANKFDLI